MKLVGLVGAFIFIMLGGYGMEDCAAHETLTCDRSTGKPRCTLVAGILTSDTTEFEGDALTAVATVRHGGKGRPTYGLAVVDRAGVSHEVVHDVKEDDGKRVDAWLAGNDPRIEVAHHRYPFGMVLAGGLIVIGLGFAITTLLAARRASAPAP